MSRDIDTLVIHCADTPNGRPFTAQDIDDWHHGRGFHRDPAARKKHRPELRAIGYHHVILLDGTIDFGRHYDEIGAHVRGYNDHSIGVCMIGRNRFTRRQWEALALLQHSLWSMYPDIRTRGHRDFPEVTKTCPGFDVAAWLANDLHPLSEHIQEEL